MPSSSAPTPECFYAAVADLIRRDSRAGWKFTEDPKIEAESLDRLKETEFGRLLVDGSNRAGIVSYMCKGADTCDA
jgi:hypothetical protein